MKFCPLLKEDCRTRDCALYASSFRKCSLNAIPFQIRKLSEDLKHFEQFMTEREQRTEEPGIVRGLQSVRKTPVEVLEAEEIIEEPEELDEKVITVLDDDLEEPEEVENT